MAVPFMKFTTRKWAVLTSKIDKLFIVIGIITSFDILPLNSHNTANSHTIIVFSFGRYIINQKTICK